MRSLFILLLLPLGIFSQTGRKLIFTDKAPKPIGPYSQAVMAGNTLYLSGQVALKADGSLDSSSIENETTQVMHNLKAVLEAAGMSFRNVVKTSIFVTDLKHFKRINEIYAGFFAEGPPARETVEVRSLPRGAHIEISMIAVQ